MYRRMPETKRFQVSGVREQMAEDREEKSEVGIRKWDPPPLRGGTSVFAMAAPRQDGSASMGKAELYNKGF
jgi:hypothetical protein